MSTTATETSDEAARTNTAANTAATTPAGLRCAGSVLRAGLAVVAGAVPTGTLTLPAMGGVHITVGEDGRSATLAATDLEVRIAHTIALDGGRAGVALAPFRKLRDLAATMPEGLAALVGLAGGGVKLVAGRMSASLRCAAPGEFPVGPTLDTGRAITVTAGVLQAAVASVAWARSTEESRPTLCGVLVRVRGGRLTTVATNGHRLARDVRALHGANETTAVEAGAVDLPDLILPARAVEALKGFAANERLTVAVEVSDEGKAGAVVAVRGTRTEVTARLIEGPYPAFERVIPSDTPHTAVLDGDALTAMVKRVSVLATTDAKRIDFTFGGTDGRLGVAVQSLDMEEAAYAYARAGLSAVT